MHTATILDDDNADLVSLVPSTGTLVPSFTSINKSYNEAVPGTTASIRVTPTVAQAGATVTVNTVPVPSGSASGLIPLPNVGSNTISIEVTAKNGTTKKIYTLVVSKAGPTNADLVSLVPSVGALSPAFLSTTLVYSDNFNNSNLKIKFTPTVAAPGATVKVNGIAVVSGTMSPEFTVTVGPNVINTVVTEPDGITTKTYRVTVNVTVNPSVAGYYTGLATPTALATNPPRLVGLGAVSLVGTGEFTGKLTLGGSSTAIVISGSLLSGTATLPIARAGLPTLTLVLTVGTDLLTGTLTEGATLVSTLTLNKLLYTSTVPAVAPLMNVPVSILNPATDKGAYTGILVALTPAQQGLPGTDYPLGSGWVTLKVATSGLVTVAGKLGDGSTVSYSNYLSKTNILPFYIAAYTTAPNGSVSGLLNFRDVPAQSDVDALGLKWFKPANPTGTSYRNGWPTGIKVDFLGSKFIAPTLANVPTARIALTDGNLPSPTLNHFAVNAASVVTILDPAVGAQNLAVTLATNGSFTGSFLHPIGARTTSLSGVILQKTQNGSGYFLGAPLAGSPLQSGEVTVSVP